MNEPQHPDLALDQSADRREVVVADDEIALPVPASDRSTAGKGRSWMVSMGSWNRGRRRCLALVCSAVIPTGAQR